MIELTPIQRAQMDAASLARHDFLALRKRQFLDALLAGDAARALGCAPWTYQAGLLSGPPLDDDPEKGQYYVIFEGPEALRFAGYAGTPFLALQRAVAGWPALAADLEVHARVREAERALRLFHVATRAEALG